MARKSRRELEGNIALPITAREIAYAAGVSPITVSRALHQPALVSDSTREHVLALVKKMGYVPNLLAGSLASCRSRLVAILLPTIADSVYAPMLQAIMEHLTEAGYQALISPMGYGPDKEAELLEAILGRRPDGIVLICPLHLQASRERLTVLAIPVVEAWDLGTEAFDMQVGFSHERVGAALAEHVVARGYEHIAVLSITDARAMRRQAALIARLQELGRSEVRLEALSTPATWEAGRLGLSRILSRNPCPDLVICSSDTLALGVLAEAQSRELRIPQDLAVFGFGDSPNGQFATPALSTISVNAFDMGTRAADALTERLAGHCGPILIDTGFQLLTRQSA